MKVIGQIWGSKMIGMNGVGMNIHPSICFWSLTLLAMCDSSRCGVDLTKRVYLEEGGN
jgi:hypothetical protein